MEHSIVVAPETRGLRVGNAPLSAAEDEARATGVGSLCAGVSEDNTDGVRFYAKLGMRRSHASGRSVLSSIVGWTFHSCGSGCLPKAIEPCGSSAPSIFNGQTIG